MSKVSKIEYPFYATNSKKIGLKIENAINPYEELTEYSVEHYYDKLKLTNTSFEDFFNMNEDDKKSLINETLKDFGTDFVIQNGDSYNANVRNGVISYSSFNFYKDDELMCSLFFDYVDGNYIKEDIPSPRRMIRLCFKDADTIKFIVDEKKYNELIFHEIVNGQEKNEQLNVVFCLLISIMNLGEFAKYHKMKSIKISTISAYLRAYPTLYDKLYIMYNYDSAYLTYSSDDEFKIYVVNYNNYIEDLDKIIDKYGRND